MSNWGLERVIGQELAKRVLMKAVREGKPAHAYLFLGLESTGKTTTAQEFAKALNCEDPRDGDACGECPICRALEHGNSPDVRLWSPDGQNTKIDQMREMRELANFKPMRGRWKVNIIEQGDTLNEESANCILKLLEEPPDYLVNILLFRNAATILPTIRSRCQLVRFTQVSANELAQRLVEDFGAEEEQAMFLAAYSQGCPGRAISLMGNESFLARRDEIIELASAASSGKPWLALKLAEVLRSRDEKKTQRDAVLEALEIAAAWYRDLLAAKLHGDKVCVVNMDRLEQIRRQTGRYRDSETLARAVDAILRTRRGILGNANPQIATEALMMRLMV